MDAILYEVGKRQLLRRREDLHAAHRLERLPQLPARNQTHQTHKRPAGTSNSESPGSPLSMLHVMQGQYGLVHHAANALSAVDVPAACRFQHVAKSWPFVFANECLHEDLCTVLGRR